MKLQTRPVNLDLYTLAQLIIAGGVFFVWVFRFDNIIKEFQHFGLSDLTRSAVGAAKVSLATLLVVGIWVPSLVMVPAILMGLLMVAAQFFHAKVSNPLSKRLPSFGLLVLCVFLACR